MVAMPSIKGGPIGHPIGWRFTSKEEVFLHWNALMGNRRHSDGPLHVGGEELDIHYDTSGGERYVVSLATLADCDAICDLSELFVRTHSDLFTHEYGGVDHETWCSYLGLAPDLESRREAIEQTVRENLAQVSRFNFHALCHTGCMLKCEYAGTRPSGSEDAGGDGTSSSLAECREWSSSSNATADSGGGTSDVVVDDRGPPRVVGYVHFSMEEGTAAEAPRSSKRLKRKRGENTGEYTKVSHLIVAPGHQGRGLGALLLAAVLHRVSRLDPGYAREIFLTVIERNMPAVQLYERLGLSVIGKNVTYLLGKGEQGRSRPVTWYQMGAERSEAIAPASLPSATRRCSARERAPSRALRMGS